MDWASVFLGPGGMLLVAVPLLINYVLGNVLHSSSLSGRVKSLTADFELLKLIDNPVHAAEHRRIVERDLSDYAVRRMRRWERHRRRGYYGAVIQAWVVGLLYPSAIIVLAVQRGGLSRFGLEEWITVGFVVFAVILVCIWMPMFQRGRVQRSSAADAEWTSALREIETRIYPKPSQTDRDPKHAVDCAAQAGD